MRRYWDDGRQYRPSFSFFAAMFVGEPLLARNLPRGPRRRSRLPYICTVLDSAPTWCLRVKLGAGLTTTLVCTGTVSMNMNVKSIGRLDHGRYEVQLESVEGDQRHTFVFVVESTRSGIDVVHWTPGFTDFMKLNMGPANPLFEAVMMFHHAGAIGHNFPAAASVAAHLAKDEFALFNAEPKHFPKLMQKL